LSAIRRQRLLTVNARGVFIINIQELSVRFITIDFFVNTLIIMDVYVRRRFFHYSCMP
jgi:hypothetical protein